MSTPDLFGADCSTYANVFTFMGRPLSRDLGQDVDAVVMGVPYDLATSARSGARYGPQAVRQASAQLRWEQKRWPWRFALADTLGVIDYGDVVYDDGSSANMVEEVAGHAARIISAGKFLLTFGGDHFITLPLLRAAAGSYGELALVHFDAHTDTEKSDLDFNHGSMFYRAPREKLIDPAHSIQVGIRTQYNYEAHQYEVLDAAWVNNHSVQDTITRIGEQAAGAPVYLSIDIDCLDPAFAPGTGTPVAGGVTTDKLLQIVRGLQSLNIVAADVMEVAPAYDHANVTALAAATLGLELLYLKGAGTKRGSR